MCAYWNLSQLLKLPLSPCIVDKLLATLGPGQLQSRIGLVFWVWTSAGQLEQTGVAVERDPTLIVHLQALEAAMQRPLTIIVDRSRTSRSRASSLYRSRRCRVERRTRALEFGELSFELCDAAFEGFRVRERRRTRQSSIPGPQGVSYAAA